jgi:hypothetical protein
MNLHDLSWDTFLRQRKPNAVYSHNEKVGIGRMVRLFSPYNAFLDVEKVTITPF